MSGPPSSPELCVYCQQRPVARRGDACWPCQSYQEYLEAEHCECPHEPSIECRCWSECTEDCPAPAPFWPEEWGDLPPALRD